MSAGWTCTVQHSYCKQPCGQGLYWNWKAKPNCDTQGKNASEESHDYFEFFYLHSKHGSRWRHTAKTQYRKFKTNILEKKLLGHSPISYIHVSVGELYIPTIGLPILLQGNRWTDRGNIYSRSFTDTWMPMMPILKCQGSLAKKAYNYIKSRTRTRPSNLS